MKYIVMPLYHPAIGYKAGCQKIGRLVQPRTRQSHGLLDITLIKPECLLEHTTQLPDLALERILVGPCKLGVEKLARDTLDLGGDLQTKDIECLVLRVEKFPGVDGIDNATGVCELATLASAVFTACPASVDQPARHIVSGHAFCEHVGVTRWLEGRCE